MNDKCLALGVDGLVELGGDGVVCGLVLQNETFVAVDALELGRFLDIPGSYILPLLLSLLLLSVGYTPPGVPVVGELLQERCLESSRLRE